MEGYSIILRSAFPFIDLFNFKYTRILNSVDVIPNGQ